jgi:hypothetical protein
LSVWEVEFTEAFGVWWHRLDEAVQEAIAHDIEVLGRMGPGLGRPMVDTVSGSQFHNMKELRTTTRRRAIRILFAFDPRRRAILLIGGDKSGDARFYQRMIPIADRLLREHLDGLHGSGHEP